MIAHELLELERALAIATELHPDHWPTWVQFLGARIEADQAWVIKTHPRGEADFAEATALALVLVGRDPGDRPGGQAAVEWRPRDREAFEADVERYRPLREAIIEATGIEPVSGAGQRTKAVQRVLFGP